MLSPRGDAAGPASPGCQSDDPQCLISSFGAFFGGLVCEYLCAISHIFVGFSPNAINDFNPNANLYPQCSEHALGELPPSSPSNYLRDRKGVCAPSQQHCVDFQE